MPCTVCLDGRGFTARPCPGCRGQQPLGDALASVWDLPKGHIVTAEDRARRPMVQWVNGQLHLRRKRGR
jgi:hypothetical protein